MPYICTAFPKDTLYIACLCVYEILYIAVYMTLN